MRFTLSPQGPFTLRTFADFQCGLLVASRCESRRGELSLAFPLDGTLAPVGMRLRERGGLVEGELFGSRDVEGASRQVARMLSLEHDARPFVALTSRTPALAAVAARFPGFRPPIFYSPYAAAGWLVLTHRLGQARAAKLQEQSAREAGDVVEIAGESVASFPRPETFLRRASFPGIAEVKWSRLQAVARAALEGALEPDLLRGLEAPSALAHLQRIEGIGPWTAAAVWLRSSGLADAFVVDEPQVHLAARLAQGLREIPDDEALAELAESWRPFRAWVSVLLTMNWYREGRPGAEALRPRGSRTSPVRQRPLDFSTARPGRGTH